MSRFQPIKEGRVLIGSTDMALIKDKSFRKYAEQYAKDEQTFFNEYVFSSSSRTTIALSRNMLIYLSFSNAFGKLIELGVPTSQFAGQPWQMGQK